jgi:hypothetical protein
VLIPCCHEAVSVFDATRRAVTSAAGAAESKTHAAVIVNACDLMSDDERRTRLDDEVVALRGLGLSANEIDLRRYFRDPSRRRGLGHELDNYDLIWVRGGNSFVLRRAMQASGLDLMLRERLAPKRHGNSQAFRLLGTPPV